MNKLKKKKHNKNGGIMHYNQSKFASFKSKAIKL